MGLAAETDRLEFGKPLPQMPERTGICTTQQKASYWSPVAENISQPTADLTLHRFCAKTDAFTDLRTGSVCRDRIGLLSTVLADGLNLGLKKMAASATTHTHWQLLRIARWHVEEIGITTRCPGQRRIRCG